MKITEIKKSLQESIDSGDEYLLQMLYATAAAYKKQHERDNSYGLSQWQKDDLDTPSTVNEPDVSWEEAKKIIRGSKS